MITQSINLNLIPSGIPQHIRVSQYDVGSRTLTFVLYNGTQKFTTAGVSAQIRGTKPDKHGFEYSATYNNGVVTCDIEQQMTIVAGEVECELILTLNSQVLGTANFILDVEKAALGNDTDISETEIPDIIDLAESHALVAEGYALGKQNGTDVGSSSPYYHNNSKYYKEQAATSATNAAASEVAAAASADHADATAADVDEAVHAVEGVVDTTYGMQDSLSIDVDGNPIEGNFAGTPAESITVDVNPTQNLHGYDKPWVGGDDINLFNCDINGGEQTYNGIKQTVIYDDAGNPLGIDADGTATGYSQRNVWKNLKAGRYKTEVIFDGGTGQYNVSVRDSQGNHLADGGSVFTLNADSSIAIRYACSSGAVISHRKVYIMLYAYSGTTKNFRPYANECPIEGISELDINVKGKNLLIMPAIDTTKNTAVCSTLKDSNNNIVGYQITGTPSAWTAFKFPSSVLANLVNGQRYKLVCKNDSANRYLAIWDQNTNSWAAQSISRTPYFTYNSSHTYELQFGCNAVYSDVKLYPMIIADTETDDTFVPYQKETDIDLEDTRYGATINIKTGEMIINRVREVLDWAEGVVVGTVGDYTYKHFKTQYKAVYPPSTGRPQLCDKAIYKADWTEASSHFYIDAQAPSSAYNTNIFLPTNASITDVEVCYELSAPQKVQLTPAQVEILKGYNRITANGNTIIHLSAVPEKLINYIVNAFGTDESGRTTASRPYAAKEYFYKDGFMYKATSAIAQNAAFTEGTNCTKTTIFAELTALNA